MKSEEIPDVEILTKIVTALRSLDRDLQVRTLQAVATFLDISLVRSSNDSAAIAHIPLPTSTTSKQTTTFSENRAFSPKEFLREKSPAMDIEKVACLAYYLTHYRDQQYFKTIDISTLNTEAAQPKFSNAAQAIENAARAGFVVQGIKGAKQLSANGELLVQTLPDRERLKEILQTFRKRGGKKIMNKKVRRNK